MFACVLPVARSQPVTPAEPQPTFRWLIPPTPVIPTPPPDAGPAPARRLDAPEVAGLTAAQPAEEIAALARALRNDPDLIYEWVHNNIETLPMFGLAKGALGTLLDGRGTPFDQAELMAALLRAAGFTPAVEVGDVDLTAAQLTAWLGASAQGYGIDPILQVGGFPAPGSGPLVTYNGDTVVSARLRWAWVRLSFDGGSFVFNPSVKGAYDPVPGVVGSLPGLMGYDGATFLSRALAGADTSVNWRISNLNRGNIRGDLATFGANLRAALAGQYPNAGPIDILGGARIVPLPLNTRQRQTAVPGVVASTVVNYPTGEFPDALAASITVALPGATGVTRRSTEVYGRRLSLFFDGARQPVLRLDGVVLATGAAQPDRQSTTINIALSYPGGAGNQSGPVFVTAGANAAYLISTSWGGAGRGMIERQRRILQENRLANPNDPNAEPVLGQSLAVLGFNWIAAVARSHALSDRIAGTATLWRHGVGIVGMSVSAPPPAPQITGPYVDLPLNVITPIQRANRPNVGDMTPLEEAVFLLTASVGSNFENGVIEQTQPGQVAVSTVMLLDTWSQQGPIVDINNRAVPGNDPDLYNSTIRPTLTAGYSGSDLGRIDTAVNGQNRRVIAPSGLPPPPAGPGIVVNNWRGVGYYDISQDRRSVGAIISGGLSGGFSTTDLPPAQTTNNLVTFAQDQSLSSANGVPGTSGGGSADRLLLGGDPLNRVTGDYVYSHDDLSVGAGAFPYGLGFQRSYDSGRSAAAPGPLGRGWTHNLDLFVQPDSDAFEGMAETSPRAGADAIAAILVVNDLLNAPGPNSKPLDRMVIAAIATRWMMDRLTGNVVRVVQPNLTESFVRTVGDSFAAPGALLPPNGSASTLTRNGDGTYTLATGDGVVLGFGAADVTTPGRIQTWTNAAGMGASFAYTGTGAASRLASVTNSFGRTLQLGYTGDRLTSVSDGTGRVVAFGYDAAGRQTSATDPLGAVTRYEYDGASGRLTRIFYPSFPATAFLTNTYDGLGRVIEQRDAVGNLTQGFFAGRRTELLWPSGNRQVWYFDPLGLTVAAIEDFGYEPDRLNLVTRTAYDGQSRPVSTTLPEGNATDTTYDAYSRPLTVTRRPKPGSPLAVLVTAFTYSGPLAGRDNFRRVATVTDPRGNVTTYGYDPPTGNLTTVTGPGVQRGGSGPLVSPTTAFTWTNRGLLASETDPEGRVTTYEYDGSGNRTGQVVDSGAGRLNLRTTWTYDAVGNATSTVPPRGNAAGANPETFQVRQVFDAKRRLIQAYQASTNSSTVFIYDADDRPTGTQRFAWDGASRPITLSTTTTYTPTGQPAVATDPSGDTSTSAYDTSDRLQSVTSSSGRRVRYEYDRLSRLTRVTDDVPSPGSLDPSITVYPGVGPTNSVLRETRTYTANSLLVSQSSYRTGGTNPPPDTLTYSYDGFDRLARTTYPAVAPDPARFEEYGYDAAGNRTLHRTRAGQDITLAYDALNRRLTRAVPAAVPANPEAPAVTYTTGYDLVGRVTRLRQSTDGADALYAYDTAGRLTGETRPDGRAIGYARDADGNLTGLTWPTEAGDAYAATYVYDPLGRVTAVFEGAGTGGLRLGAYTYDTASRRLSLDRGTSGARTVWGWRPDGRVQSLAHAFSGGATISFTYLYNREGAVSARLVSDATWQATPAVQASTAYVANPLNQYATVGGTALTYDANGNLTGDGAATYRYDPQNRLVGYTVSGGPTVSYAYDPEGRRLSRTQGAATTAYLYALGQEIAEYSPPGTLSARHVPGAGLDEPLATITGAPTARVRVWYHADAQGSVIARSGAGGALPAAGQRFTYTPYGVTGPGSGAPPAFRYVGRRLDPTAPGGLYDMRARVYSPTLGRFLQPDPIGTEGGLNLYAYVENDPLNLGDPLGTAPVEMGSPDNDIILAAGPRRNPVTGEGPGTQRTQPIPEGGGGGGGGISGRTGSNVPQPPQAPYNFYDHAVRQMIDRGYNYQDLNNALQNVVRTIQQSNGNVVFVGRNGMGVVVDPSTNQIVTVLRPGMIPR